MAIVKEYVTPQGITANYHRIVKIDLNAHLNKLDIVVGIFVDKEKARAGCAPIWHEYFSIPIENLAIDPRSTFYPLLVDSPGSYLHGGEHDTI